MKKYFSASRKLPMRAERPALFFCVREIGLGPHHHKKIQDRRKKPKQPHHILRTSKFNGPLCTEGAAISHNNNESTKIFSPTNTIHHYFILCSLWHEISLISYAQPENNRSWCVVRYISADNIVIFGRQDTATPSRYHPSHVQQQTVK